MKCTSANANESPVFCYETQHYDRRYLDCWRRQAVVLLQKLGAPVDYLFYSAFSSTEDIFEQHILMQKPKYAFSTLILNQEGLELIGWRQRLQHYEALSDAEEDIKLHLKTVPFVILMGSVFYFPHCPEYRQEHLNHSVGVLQIGHDGNWAIVDDDPASVLECYSYSKSYIENFFDNNGTRIVRYFDKINSPAQNQIADAAIAKCRAHFSSYHDSYRLLKEIEDVSTNAHESVSVRAKKIHESFSLYSGSRSLFARFSERILGDINSSLILREISEQSLLIKNAMTKAAVSGKLNVTSLTLRCDRLLSLETQVLSSLNKRLGIL